MRGETFLFVVDTDQYAGNFERQMVAHMSGRYGDCGVGDDIAAVAEGEIVRESPAIAEWLQDNVLSESDDRGCRRPATIWPTPGWFSDGLGTQWRDDADPAAVRARFEASVREIYKGSKDTQRREEMLERGPLRYPAYQSVAMWLAEEPTPEVVALLKARVLDFARNPRSPRQRAFEVLGFRLVRRLVTYEDRAL